MICFRCLKQCFFVDQEPTKIYAYGAGSTIPYNASYCLQLVNSILVDYPTYKASMPPMVAGYVCAACVLCVLCVTLNACAAES
jgi:hypothetical protein